MKNIFLNIITYKCLVIEVIILRLDFISLELDRGQPRLLIDFGSGTLELKVKTKKPLDDGDWHRVDIFWDTEVTNFDDFENVNTIHMIKICLKLIFLFYL